MPTDTFMHCPNRKCRYGFCQYCGGDERKLKAHGTHFHHRWCKAFAFAKRGHKDRHLPVYPEEGYGSHLVHAGERVAGQVWCPECFDLGKMCEPIKDLPSLWKEKDTRARRGLRK